jgi:hypothetical protein
LIAHSSPYHLIITSLSLYSVHACALCI